eukprot:GFYU01002662.1.p1 GENE.GFYU01002662.1~~GFYU01002662.1.p1  ORF type:complete len:364 (+),score=37.02 GFYU01002662.1:159-1250(+)
MWLPTKGNQDVIEVGEEAFWSTSTSCAGHDVSKTRDDNLDTYWQSASTGAPHHINIQFPKEKTIQDVKMFADLRRDEKFTPTKISVRAGSTRNNMHYVIESFSIKNPAGWVTLPISTSVSMVRAAVIQIQILEPSEVRVRQIKIYSPNATHEGMDNHARLVADYRRLLNNPEFSDLEFMVEGKKIHAHRVILTARSECFRAMLTSGMKESRERQVFIDNIAHDVFWSVLEFIYTEECAISPDKAMDILEAADRFQLDSLKEMCEDVMAKCIDMDNVADMIQEADRHMAHRLKRECLDYVITNAPMFVESEGFKHIEVDLLREVFGEYVKASKLKTTWVPAGEKQAGTSTAAPGSRKGSQENQL